MDQFTAVATARADALQRKIERQINQASIRCVFAPLFDMIVESLSTTISKGTIVPISEQGQPVGEVYLLSLAREGETFDPTQYDLNQYGIGEIPINPAPIVDALLSQYGAQGAIQVKSLFNLDVERWLGYGMNEIIFDGKEYQTAAEYLNRFKIVKDGIAGSQVAQVFNHVLTELEGSVNMALAWAKAKAEWSNQALKSGDLKKFSPYEAKVFKFSGVTPIDEAMNQVALNQAALANSLPGVVEGLKEAAIESKPDYGQIGAAIAAGVKEGIKEVMAAVQQPAQPAKEKESAPSGAKPKTNRN